MKCVVFGAGKEFPEKICLPDEKCFVIAADGGLKKLEELGILPDHIVGDLDSLDAVPDSGNFTRLPHVKDTTDMFEAVRIGSEHGCDEFHLYGGTGGRLDHTLANIQLAAMVSESGQRAFIYGGNYVITAITDGALKLPERESGFVSVFAHSDECSGVDIKGLFYETDGAVLKNDFALGVSNEFIGKEASVSIKSGTLVIYYEI